MSKSYKEHLNDITTFVFDFDGVFTNGQVQIMGNGEFVRSLYVKDSYAIQYAIKKGYRVVIISGGSLHSLKASFEKLGLTDFFFQSKHKESIFTKYITDNNISASEVLFMGDDIPDYVLMEKAGVATCPADAVTEIKSVSQYISPKKGGHGCIRDVIEQTLKAQGKWLDKDAFEW